MLSSRLIRFMMATIVKKPKMELTLRTPYRTHFLNQKPFSRILTASIESSLKPLMALSSYKTEHLQLFTYSLQEP